MGWHAQNEEVEPQVRQSRPKPSFIETEIIDKVQDEEKANILINIENNDSKVCKLKKDSQLLPQEKDFYTMFSKLENLISNPGLQHIAENITCHLNFQALEACEQIFFPEFGNFLQKLSKSFLMKFALRGMSEKQQIDWKSAIEITKGTKNNMEIVFVFSYLKKCFKNENVSDLHCYMDEEFFQRSARMIMGKNLTNENFYSNKDGWTPIHRAVANGDLEMVKILAPLIDNPNAPDRYGETPIYFAVSEGYTEIVRILSPLAENPNAPNKYGDTPIKLAKRNGFTEIVGILDPLIEKNVNINQVNSIAESAAAIHGYFDDSNPNITPIVSNIEKRLIFQLENLNQNWICGNIKNLISPMLWS